MKISTVKIKNFRGFGENPKTKDGFYVFYDLDKADFLILNGFNGFGKTSFFEAIEWCLTNSVKRLKKLEDKDKQDNISEIRNSHYLIYYKKNDTNRAAEVEITFDNSKSIKRITTAKSLADNKYNEKTEFIINGNKETDINKCDLEGYHLYNIFKFNFIGQETILNLIRNQKPSERSAHFLSLANQNIMNKIHDNSQYKKFGFDRKKAEKETIVYEFELAIENANKYFEDSVDYNGIDDYIQKLNIAKNEFENLSGRFTHKKSDDWIEKRFINVEIDKTNCFEFVRNNINRIEKAEKTKNEYSNQKKDKENFKLLHDLISFYEKHRKLNILKDIDIETFEKHHSEKQKKLSEIKTLFEKHESIVNLVKKNEKVWDLFSETNSEIKELIKNPENTKNAYVESKDSIRKFYHELFNSENEDIIIEDGELKTQYKDLIKKIDDIKFGDIITLINSYTKNLKRNENDLKIQKETQKKLSQLNQGYIQSLNSILDYLNSEKDIKECPVCLNKDFSIANKKHQIDNFNELSIKEKLKKIIDSQIESGNQELKKINDKINAIKEGIKNLESRINENINVKFIARIEDVKEIYRLYINKITNSLKSKKVEFDKSNTTLNIEITELKEKIKAYKKSYKEIFDSEYGIDEKTKPIDIKLIEDVENEKETLKTNLHAKGYNVISEVETKKEQENLKNKVEEISDSIEELSNKISDLELIHNSLQGFKKFQVTEEEEKEIKKSYDADKKIETLKEDIESIENDKKVVNSINENIIAKKEQVLKTIFDNELIKKIYNDIEPNFRFKDLELIHKQRGKTSENYLKSGNIYLDHIFSSAQLNTLALSVFLGMGLPETFSKFDQLFLDDPIQSMDDLNVLALIDIFRAIVDNPKAKMLIVATHDDNFAKLLQIKMRNKNIKMIDFESYGEEGPVISVN